MRIYLHFVKSVQMRSCFVPTTGKYGLEKIPYLDTFHAVTAQKMKFSIKDFFSKCDQIRCLFRIWSHFLKKSLMKNFFCTVSAPEVDLTGEF